MGTIWKMLNKKRKGVESSSNIKIFSEQGENKIKDHYNE